MKISQSHVTIVKISVMSEEARIKFKRNIAKIK